MTVTAFQTRKQHEEQEEGGEAHHKNYSQDFTMQRVVSVSCEGNSLTIFRTQGLHRRVYHYRFYRFREKTFFPSSGHRRDSAAYYILSISCLDDSMSGAEDNKSPHAQLSSQVFLDLVDSVIADVASECHRIARLGLDRDLEVVEEELRLSVEARAKVADPSNNLETNTKYVVDIFGQTHPPVASEVFNCMNCGRQIVAGRFAPHLEKCMGKGRKARTKVTRSTTAAQNRNTRPSPNQRYSPYLNSGSENRLASGSHGVAGEDYSNDTVRENVKGD